MNTNMSLRVNVPKIVHETIDGETVILNLDSGNYYSLDEIGADIWALVENNAAPAHIIESICGHYDGTREEMEAALRKFISQLIQEGLVVSDGRDTSDSPNLSPGRINLAKKEDRPVFQPPVLSKYTDMQDLLLLDPIHEVDDAGWPERKSPEDESGAKEDMAGREADICGSPLADRRDASL